MLIPLVIVKKVVKKVEVLLKNVHSCPIMVDSLEKWTIFFVLEKSSTTLGAVKALRKADFNTDALALSRSIIENLANLTYLFDKPKERLELFLKYEYIEKYQALREFESDFPAEAIAEELKEEIYENYHKYKNLFPNKFSWSGKSIVKMLSDCSFHSDFAMAYKMSSRYLHEPFALQTFFTNSAKDTALYFAWSCLNKPTCSYVYRFFWNMR